MRTRLVFWGKDDKQEKVLIAVKLNQDDNNIDVYIFSENDATEDFVTQMHKSWRVGGELEFPAATTHLKRALSISEPMIPEGFTVEREDILKRAQTEWQFVVLSSKLFHSYQEELSDIKEKVIQAVKFDPALWETLKGFWSKVQEQARDRNLFRDHANTIREHTNELFSTLKKLRKEMDKEFNEVSGEHLKQFKEKLGHIEKKILDGLSLQPIFQELKEIQKTFKNAKFTRDHRSEVWKKLDGLFKQVKEKKYGHGNESRSSPLERVKRRYDGLLHAITKMERSITRDRKDLNFQNHKIENAEGSLEAQIRVAKTNMIEERIRSKEEKLIEMKNTQTELDRKMEVLKRKEEKLKESEKLRVAKESIKEEIAVKIKDAEKAREGDDTIQKAAQAIKEPAEDLSILETIEDGLEDVIDTIKAVAFVIESKVEDLIDDLQEGRDEEE